MLKIVICDEDEKFVEYLADILSDVIERNNLMAKIVFKHSDIYEASKFIDAESADIFFTDVLFGKNQQELSLLQKLEKKILIRMLFLSLTTMSLYLSRLK